jgi:hypothetical protein
MKPNGKNKRNTTWRKRKENKRKRYTTWRKKGKTKKGLLFPF